MYKYWTVVATDMTEKDARTYVRMCAAWALGDLGEHAKDAVPTLTEYLKDSDWRVRSSAVSWAAPTPRYCSRAHPRR